MWAADEDLGESKADIETGRSGTSQQSDRRFPMEFHELDEGGMSQLSAACDAAGIRQLFLAAMKL